VAAGELVGDQRARVVAGALVGAARVAQADDYGGPSTRSPAVFLSPESVEKRAYGNLFLDVLARGTLALLG
jgi:hypothetical protein